MEEFGFASATAPVVVEFLAPTGLYLPMLFVRFRPGPVRVWKRISVLIPGRLNGHEYLPLSFHRSKRAFSSEKEALKISPSEMMEMELKEGRVDVESWEEVCI